MSLLLGADFFPSWIIKGVILKHSYEFVGVLFLPHQKLINNAEVNKSKPTKKVWLYNLLFKPKTYTVIGNPGTGS